MRDPSTHPKEFVDMPGKTPPGLTFTDKLRWLRTRGGLIQHDLLPNKTRQDDANPCHETTPKKGL